MALVSNHKDTKETRVNKPASSGSPPLQGGECNVPLAKGDGRWRRQGALPHDATVGITLVPVPQEEKDDEKGAIGCASHDHDDTLATRPRGNGPGRDDTAWQVHL